MKRLFFLAALVSLSCISCKAKKEAAKTTESAPPAANLAATQESPKTYRLIVSFKSKGAGTPSEKRAAFLKYVDNHPQKPSYQTVLWGREGETDYCFDLAELASKKDQVLFLEEVKRITTGSDLIDISENAECQHKGR
ncbi:MAG: hypothetical protein K0S53_2122 [Bacteroidetes bacterium]|jgi:hypothetical protein|nr:hypothetical protein [Bacteroidota bacterium]MDF2453290.1 hypothetical protein [Bacteroidota bacterium]